MRSCCSERIPNLALVMPAAKPAVQGLGPSPHQICRPHVSEQRVLLLLACAGRRLAHSDALLLHKRAPLSVAVMDFS